MTHSTNDIFEINLVLSPSVPAGLAAILASSRAHRFAQVPRVGKAFDRASPTSLQGSRSWPLLRRQLTEQRLYTTYVEHYVLTIILSDASPSSNGLGRATQSQAKAARLW